MEVKIGDRLRIYQLKGGDRTYDVPEGVVEHIGGTGALHGTWGGLAVIPDEDDYQII